MAAIDIMTKRSVFDRPVPLVFGDAHLERYGQVRVTRWVLDDAAVFPHVVIFDGSESRLRCFDPTERRNELMPLLYELERRWHQCNGVDGGTRPAVFIDARGVIDVPPTPARRCRAPLPPRCATPFEFAVGDYVRLSQGGARLYYCGRFVPDVTPYRLLRERELVQRPLPPTTAAAADAEYDDAEYSTCAISFSVADLVLYGDDARPSLSSYLYRTPIDTAAVAEAPYVFSADDMSPAVTSVPASQLRRWITERVSASRGATTPLVMHRDDERRCVSFMLVASLYAGVLPQYLDAERSLAARRQAPDATVAMAAMVASAPALRVDTLPRTVRTLVDVVRQVLTLQVPAPPMSAADLSGIRSLYVDDEFVV